MKILETSRDGLAARFVRVALPALLTVVLFVVSIFAIILPRLEQHLVDQERKTLRTLADSVWSDLHALHARVAAGEIPRNHAQKRAVRRIRELRYGPEHKDYFWISDLDANMIMHPYRPELEGRNLKDYRDTQGNRVFAEFARIAEAKKAGYARYQWQKHDDPDQLSPKLSYVKVFEPWGWIIGTGLYMDTLERKLAAIRWRLSAVSLGILGIVLLLALLIVHQHGRTDRARQAAVSALRESEAKYRELVESANSVILRMDLEGRVSFLNTFGRRFFGYAQDDILGRNVVGTIVPERDTAGQDLGAMIRQIIASPETFRQNENENQRRDGSRVWISWTNRAIRDADDQVTGVLCIGNDITDRKRAEDDAKKERAFALSLINASPIYIVAIDAQGKTLLMNPAMREALGYTREEVESTDYLARFVPDEEREKLSTVFEQILAGTGGADIENHVLTRAGERRLVDWHDRLVSKDDGSPDFFFGVGLDITEKRRAEAEQRACEARLQHTQNLELIGRLASGIAHDFNNLLAGILGYAQLLEDSDLPKEKLAAYSAKIQEASRRGAELVQQLLSFSRKREPSKTLVDVHRILSDTTHLLAHSIDRRIDVRLHLDASSATVVGDAQELQSALLNLGANARDAMPDGGELTYASRDTFLTEALCTELSLDVHPGHYLEVTVRDTGEGMDAETIAHLFEPFFTTKTPGKGTGLGLAAVQSCIQAHGGTIKVDSEPGQGSRFRLYLPASDSETREATQNGSIPLETGEGTILVADDEAFVREVLQGILTGCGYRVVLTSNGEEAVAHYQEHADEIDLVILDMIMPGRNGLETYHALRAIDPGVKALIASGHLFAHDPRDLTDQGLLGVLAKPFMAGDLSRHVAHAIQAPPPVIMETRATPSADESGDVRTTDGIGEPGPIGDETSEARPVATSSQQARILIIDDDEMVRESLRMHLTARGHDVSSASGGEQGLAIFAERGADIVITDLQMPDCSGVDVLRAVRKRSPEAIVLVVTAYATVESSLEALQLGAAEYFPKPVNLDHLQLVIARALEQRQLAHRADQRSRFSELIGASRQMNAVYRQIEAVAATETTVLIQGETGTGKELVARAIHETSPREGKPFIPVNCGSLPESVLETELFGYHKGAFTGADADKAGLFAAATGGTLMLDEIEAASPRTQVALLRVLDRGEIMPVGSRQPESVDVRVLVASNERLEAMVADGRFREDLFYRIIESTITLPPLRDRPEDIPLLAEHFLSTAAQTGPRAKRCLSPQALSCLGNYTWPGNVRELENMITHTAQTVARPIIRPADLPERVRLSPAESQTMPTLEEMERDLLDKALTRCSGNKAEAARVLGVSRSTIYSLLRKHGLSDA